MLSGDEEEEQKLSAKMVLVHNSKGLGGPTSHIITLEDNFLLIDNKEFPLARLKVAESDEDVTGQMIVLLSPDSPPIRLMAEDSQIAAFWRQAISEKCADSVDLSDFTVYMNVKYNEESTHPKHMLDIFVPPNSLSGQVSVVVHIHGGGWKRGDRQRWFYGAPFMAQNYAKRGFVSVAVSYRLMCQHPASVGDVAQAVGWVRKNIARYHGNPDSIFLSGHSAGGHIVSLLCADPSYLKANDVDLSCIKGVVSISGIYTLQNPMGSDSKPCHWRNYIFRQMYSNSTFGTSESQLNAASPTSQILSRFSKGGQETSPPFFLINAESDFGLEKDARRMERALQTSNIFVKSCIVPGTNHATVTRSKETVTIATSFFRDVLARGEKSTQ